ncbi:MAG: hypothetical protein HY644_03170 [Acidobacteria bacterium]|nr:hypothetical protein [Acidobacteriota bacterium]
MMLAVLFAVLFFSPFSPLVVPLQVRDSLEEEKLKATIAGNQDPIAQDQAFRTLIDGYLQRGNCDEAQQWLNRARDRKVLTQFASYLLEIGRCLEEKFPERARQLYQKIVVDYPDEKDEIGDSYADSARRRLIWLSNDRSWRVRSRIQLVNVLGNAVRRRDYASLQKYVSKVNFIFGACQSEFLNSDLEEIATFLDENYARGIKVTRRVQNYPFREGWFVLETHGWSTPYDYIYFLMQPITGGWEWIGAIYCDEPLVPRPSTRR